MYFFIMNSFKNSPSAFGTLIIFTLFFFSMMGCSSTKSLSEFTLTEEQEHIRKTIELFHKADEKLKTMESVQAELLSPDHFETGKEYFAEATKYLVRERIDRIRPKLADAIDAFEKAKNASAVAKVQFETVLVARNKAIKANAPGLSEEKWEEAEERFKKATRALEDDKVSRARRHGERAREAYDAAELAAIQAHHLSTARSILEVANNEKAYRNAPFTYQKADSLIKKAENLLKDNRYEISEPVRLAQKASYHASYNLYLHYVIDEMKDDKQTFEDVFLKADEALTKIANALGITIRLDSGLESSAETILATIDQMMKTEIGDARKTILMLEKKNEELSGELDQKKEQLRLMRNELKLFQQQIEEKKELADIIEIQRKRDQAIQNVRNLITVLDGDVFLDGSNILIRLHGLSFPIGKSTIEPQYFGLLRNVQDAIKLFPNAKIVIEGHTDSRGSDELNERLSLERAKAVAQYIEANIGKEIDMSASGFGPNRPVATNETEAGRKMNRRIDVVITPEWAR